jgi:hypothetical protein
MLSILVIAIGIAVLAFGKRLAVLGAAVGALLGVALFSFFPQTNAWVQLLVVILLAVIGFLLAGFAKAIVDLVLLVLGVLAGAAIMLAFLELFDLQGGLVGWLLVLLGGVAGLILVRRFKDWAMIILAGLIGGLLVVRGLSEWFPSLDGTLGTLVVLVLAGGSIAYQGGWLRQR